MTGILYLVPNALGKTECDQTTALASIIPIHVQTIIAQLDYFIAENAKTTRAFLKVVALTYPLRKQLQEIQISEFNVNSKEQEIPALLQPILKGRDAGLISEAGVPAVADPGANLVRLAHTYKIPVKPLVGPSSLLLAIMASGLNGQSFAFNGYLPTEFTQREKRIKYLENRSQQEKQTQLFIETPYRNRALLEAVLINCHSNTLLCVATDLTLPSESVCTQTIEKWRADLVANTLPDLHRKPTVFLLLAAY